MVGAGEWALLCGLATVTKLSSSVDDVAWLLPYMNARTLRKQLINGALYLALMQAVVGLAIAVGIGGRKAVQSLVSDQGYWNTQRVLSLASGGLLALYAGYLFYDWWTGLEEEPREEPADQEANPAGLSDAATGAGTGAGSESATPEDDGLRRRMRPGGGGQGAWTEAHQAALRGATEAEEHRGPEAAAEEPVDEPSTLSLVTVALLGSLDDFCVFFGLLLSDTFRPVQLAIGVLLGSVLVVLFCKGATFFKPVVWLLERVPLWAIVACFATWTFVTAFVEF